MIMRLIFYYCIHLYRIKDLFIIYWFRKFHENSSLSDDRLLNEWQFVCVSEKMNVSVDRVKGVVQYWMYIVPLDIIYLIRYRNVVEFIRSLPTNQWVILSDYPAEAKANALGLHGARCFSSSSSYINSLKPNPKGVLYILNKYSIKTTECLLIGDRDEKDGRCARNAGIDCLILSSNYIKRMHQIELLREAVI